MASKSIPIVQWLQNWFPLKGSTNYSLAGAITYLEGLISGKSDSTHGHGNINTNGRVTNTNNSPNNIVVTDGSGNLGVASSISASRVQYSGQATVGTAIQNLETEISALQQVEFVRVVSSRPTASADTMNAIYIVTGGATSTGSTFESYITYKDGNTYKWEQIDDAELKGFITETNADAKYVAKESGKALFPSSEYNIGSNTSFAFFTGQGQYTNLYTFLNNLPTSGSTAPKNHAVTDGASSNPYGVGTATLYGHCRVVNNFSQSSHIDGVALSAFKGYQLNNEISRVEGLIVDDATEISYTPTAADWGEFVQVVNNVSSALTVLQQSKANRSEVIDIDSITLVDPAVNSNGVITFETID